MIALVVLTTIAFVGGVTLVVVPPSDVPTPPSDPRRTRRLAIRVLGGLAVGTLVALVSGWLVPGVVIGAGTAWAIGGWQRRQRSSEAEIERLDALAGWVENVRDVLMAGEQPIGAITSTVSASAPIVRPHVRRLAVGLGQQDPEVAFRRFADDLDDPLADLVAAGLSIAIRRGARTVPVLTALAEQTREQVDRRRLVEAERAPTRREVQALTVIMGALVVGLLVFGRSEYLDAYDTVGGQVFLGLALAGYVGLIIRVQHLARFPRPGRFLTGDVGVARGAR
ncbi:MAG: hypothetical protein CL424_00670 [Acidimicrobiaceae bacterium]|nr:hypothetical protein [Acidimicrobiaceae bacterium]